MHKLEIAQVREEANETRVIQLRVPAELEAEFAFAPGQYLTFVEHIGGEEVRRSYSICSALGAPLEVAIKRIPGGLFSEHAHSTFRAGTIVNVLPPAGSFHTPLSPDQAKHYLCIAAGSGITPIISILESVLAVEPRSTVTLIYGSRRSSDIIFRERLLWLKNAHIGRFHWINIISQEAQPADILEGRIDNRKGAALSRRLIDIPGFDEFFLCGPEAMISEVARGLRGEGVEEAQIHYELFFASAEDARAAIARHQQRAREFAGLTTEVRVRSGGREIAFELTADGENVLDGAMRHGLELPFSCKGGVCATCKARVVEGKVDMDLNHALSQSEIEDGYVLTCQAHPISRHVVVDFDAR